MKDRKKRNLLKIRGILLWSAAGKTPLAGTQEWRNTGKILFLEARKAPVPK